MRADAKIILLTLLILGLSGLTTAESWTFTNCGEEGTFGPSSCNYDYIEDIIGEGIQTFEVPSSGTYRIVAEGAGATIDTEQGGRDSDGRAGKGARMEGEFSLNEGDVLRILVGQRPIYWSDERYGAGAGGTFIVREVDSGDTMFDGQDVEPLIIAGGGGGKESRRDSEAYDGIDANTGESAFRGTGGDAGDGGEDGHGGQVGDPGEGNSSGAGGGGYLSTGEDTEEQSRDGIAEGGDSFLEGGVGGLQTDGEDGDTCKMHGAFGGGGGSGCAAGGGGGYSGGGGGSTISVSEDWERRLGGGGGSYNQGDNQESERRAVYDDHGQATVELLTAPDDPDIQTPFSPSKIQASSTSSPADMSFSVDVSIDDDGGAADDNTLDQCDVTATGQDNGGSVNPSTSIASSGSGGGTGTCEFSVDNDDSSNWEPGETIDVEVSVEDSYSGTDTISREHEFENTAPETVDVSVVEDDVHSEYDNEVWGGENGVALEVEVVDYESATTNTDVDVEIFGDLGQVGSTLTASNGDDTVSVNWERDGESDMLGFDRGESYSFSAEASDVEGAMSSDSGSLDVLSEASVSDPFPVGGESADQLEINVGDNPAIDVDEGLDEFDVEFWIKDGPSFELEGADTVSGSSGTATLNIETLELDDPPAEWKFVIDDTYSETDYGESPYDDNTNPSAPYSFVTAEAPVILEGDSSSGPVDESGVELNPDLEILVDDPDNSDVEVTFYEGETGSDQIGDSVTVSDGNGVATLESGDHSLGENAGDSFEWSVRAEDVEFGEVAESDTFSVDIVEEPDISFETPEAGDSSDVAINEDLTVEITQGDDETVGVDYTVENSDTFTDTGTVSDTESGSTFSSSFDLEPDTEYTWTVEASFTDDGGSEISVEDDLTFDTAEVPEFIDFSPDDGESGLENPELEVEFDDNGNPVTVEFYDWENNEVLDTQTGVTSGEASFDTSSESGFGDEAGNSYFWYAVLEDEIKGTVQNSSMPGDDPWEFRTPEVLDADIDIERGDGHNMNPGSADLGPENLQISATNDEELNMESAEISIDGTVVDTVSPVPHGQTISVDITEDVVEDEEYSWSVEIIEDGIIIAEESGLEFSTHVVDAQWVTGDPELTAGFNVYHSNSDDLFEFGEGSYSQVGSTSDEELKLAIEDLGYNGDDCFRVTAHNSAGESSDASPPLEDSAECVGGEIS